MKGFVITLDATIALAFAIFVVVLIASQNYNPRTPGIIYLKQLSLDTVTVIEKTGSIQPAISGNTSGIQEILEATPELACMAITVTNSTGELMTITKNDCNETSELNIQIIARPVLYQNGEYMTKTESWFRKEPS